jgi:plasmid stabilization system protein ParE
MRRIILSPDAKADLRSTIRWYKRTDPNLALRFKLEMRASLRRIARFPYQFPLIEGTFRRANLKRFRYAIFFFCRERARVVRAVIHERRADSIWKDRGNGYS